MENLKQQIQDLVSECEYEFACQLVAKEFGIQVKVISCEYKTFFNDDKLRYVFKLKLTRGKKCYTFEFGQSINNGSQQPTIYDVLGCFQKYDVGSFDDFCSEFGYDNELDTSLETYKAVLKEYAALSKMFNEDELDVLREIC